MKLHVNAYVARLYVGQARSTGPRAFESARKHWMNTCALHTQNKGHWKHWEMENVRKYWRKHWRKMEALETCAETLENEGIE